ncbi:MAG TPA: hypothetical protein VK436_03335 [Methanocella sp.]|nr:hypothetical protein [Methanocella sp.]
MATAEYPRCRQRPPQPALVPGQIRRGDRLTGRAHFPPGAASETVETEWQPESFNRIIVDDPGERRPSRSSRSGSAEHVPGHEQAIPGDPGVVQSSASRLPFEAVAVRPGNGRLPGGYQRYCAGCRDYARSFAAMFMGRSLGRAEYASRCDSE